MDRRTRLHRGRTFALETLRASTAELHRRAERSGTLRAALLRRVSPRAYALLLRNLLPVYEAMESAPRPVVPASLHRAAALRADLAALAGRDWKRVLPVLPEGERYARRVRTVARRDAALLAVHAYVRYLGDLNGGRVLRRLLEGRPGFPSTLAFHRFPAAVESPGFLARLRARLARAIARAAGADLAVREAARGFRFNIALSEAVARHEARSFRPR